MMEGTGGAPAECAAYADQPSTNAIAIHVVNKRAQSIYIATECVAPFDVEVGGVPQTSLVPSIGTTCEQAQQGIYKCCDCDFYATQEIPSQGSWDSAWAGVFYESQQMPPLCYGAGPLGGPGSSCYQAIQAPPSAMTLDVHLSSTPNYASPFDARKDFQLGTDRIVEVDVN